ncbi:MULTISPECIES: AEC family transporter [unclassified Mesotoga]|uniref:AEC family transporter n=1 Tax=unclassified Mesotoga TaxID=1184398 RepID=UPI000EF1C814|nr:MULTISPECIES: AEC family transporter [unclassified Mesotoga]MDD4826000.1 AEC family transporter [Mesotoga sp.]MDI9368609.1 AEC family transporter [Thermotogota bacterium]NLT46530.1 AEC family transporter [Thermotogaceae bacterium]
MTEIVSKVLTFFVLIGIGFILRRTNLVDDLFTKGVSRFVLYVTLPALIVDSMNFEYSYEMFSNSVILLIAGGALYLILWLMGVVSSKILRLTGDTRSVFLYAVLFGNVAYMGYPVVELIIGKEGVFYSAVFNIWFNVLTWTVGVRIMSREAGSSTRKAFLNPGMISVFIGLILFFTPLKLPLFLDEALALLGQSTVPLAMVVAGIILASAKLSTILKSRTVIFYSLVKLCIAPVIVFFLLSAVEMPTMVEKILIIMSAMPAAANTSIFARIFDSDYELSSKLIASSTLFSMITIPLIISFLD